MTLIDHLERFLGLIELGWERDADGEQMPFQVVRLGDPSNSETISFASLGLGRYPLASPASGRVIRHELMMLVPATMQSSPVPSLIHQVGSAAIHGQKPLLRSDVIGPYGPLVPGSFLEALYVIVQFATYEGDDGPMVIAWLVPSRGRRLTSSLGGVGRPLKTN